MRSWFDEAGYAVVLVSLLHTMFIPYTEKGRKKERELVIWCPKAFIARRPARKMDIFPFPLRDAVLPNVCFSSQ